MLILSRKIQESVVIESPEGAAGLIRITVVSIRGGRVRLGFEAANGVAVDREEVWEQRQAVDRTPLAEDGSATLKREQMERWEDDGGEVKPEVPLSRPQVHFSDTSLSETGQHKSPARSQRGAIS